MANVTGRRSYNVRADRIIPNVMPKILLLDPNIEEAGYLAFLNKLKSKRTMQEKITWDVDEFLPTTDTVDGAVSSTTQTTIKVDNPSYYIPGELWEVKRTREKIGIKEVSLSTSTISVIRGITALNSSGGTAAAAILDGDQLNKISSYVSENSSRQVTKTTTPTEVYNYCQQFRMDLSMSQRQLKREFENDNELSYQEMKQLKEFRMDMDRAFLFGQKARFTDENGDDVTLTDGIDSVITTNVFDVGGTLFKNQFDEFLIEEGNRYGSRNKVIIASNKVILAFTQMLDSNSVHYIDLSATKGAEIGTNVLRYIDPKGGQLLIMEDRNLSEQHNGTAFGVDLTQLEMRDFSNNGISGQMHIIKGTQDPDDPGVVNTIMADIGLTYGIEKTHFKLTNVEGGAFNQPTI